MICRSSADTRAAASANRSADQVERSRWTSGLSFQNKALPIDVMTASTRSPCSTRARSGASISNRRCSARRTGIASEPPCGSRAKLVEQLVHPPGQRQIAEPHQIGFGRIRAKQVDRFVIEIARIAGSAPR